MLHGIHRIHIAPLRNVDPTDMVSVRQLREGEWLVRIALGELVRCRRLFCWEVTERPFAALHWSHLQVLVLLAGSRSLAAIVKDEQIAAGAIPSWTVGVGKGLKDLVRR